MGNFQEYNASNADIQNARNDQRSNVQKQIDAQPQHNANSEVFNGSYETTIGKGTVKHGVTTVNATDLESGHRGILGSARTFSGAPALNITDKTTISLPGGMQTTAETAARLGYLVKQPDGSYRNADDKEPE